MLRDREIMEKRAMKLATLPAAESTANMLVVEFVLHPEHYAFETAYVKEVLTLKELTSIPGTPEYVMGVILFRGKILSILNLKNLFGLREQGLTEFNKILVISNQQMEFGILADRICNQNTIDSATLSDRPIHFGSSQVDFIKGITPEGLILLDAEKMLGSKSLIVNH